MHKDVAPQLLRTFAAMITHGDAKGVSDAIARRFYSTERNYVLRRDLAIPFSAPPARLQVEVRPARNEDIAKIVAERPRRLRALEAGVSTCYVAACASGDICYMQWLIDPSQNELIRRLFKDFRPSLKADERLLEWAYTFKQYRGLSIMSHAMARISEQAIGSARWLITFVNEQNIASLRGCRSAGYRPFMMQTQTWRWFRPRQTLKPLGEGAKYPFELKSPAAAQGCAGALRH